MNFSYSMPSIFTASSFMNLRTYFCTGIATLVSWSVLAAGAHAQQAQSFPDVPPNHYAYQAVEFLKANNFVSGYDDGTFRPGSKVNRAEAMKFIVAPLIKQEILDQFASVAFPDVADDAWFMPYVAYGVQAGVIDGPSKKPAFYGANPVIKVEFLKMLLLANNIDPNAYSEIHLPLSSDVQNPDEWYYPYMRYAISSSMMMISENGTLEPAKEMTRADTAVFLHRLLMYREGRRTQALLSEAESEILVILGTLEKNDIEQAEYASARALIAARGAHASKPDIPVVQSALKITEAFRALVSAYRTGIVGDLDKVINFAGDAWNLAEKAKNIEPNMAKLAEQVQNIAKNMADSARQLKEEQQQ